MPSALHHISGLYSGKYSKKRRLYARIIYEFQIFCVYFYPNFNTVYLFVNSFVSVFWQKRKPKKFTQRNFVDYVLKNFII